MEINGFTIWFEQQNSKKKTLTKDVFKILSDINEGIKFVKKNNKLWE